MSPIHPNLITAMRLPLAPLAVVALTWGGVGGTLLAAVLSLLLELTDLADGYIARRYGQVSDFGKLFDPFADAFCRFTLFLGIQAIGHADLWMILIIFYRDSSIAFLRSIAATRGVVIAARSSGKIKAIVQGVGTQVCYLALLGIALWPDATPWLGGVPWISMLIITVVTAWSWVDYLASCRSMLVDVWNDRPAA
jgi:CDP-diacylglycerol--glycerol-3-phosphate 3-phosphatidyltransferase